MEMEIFFGVSGRNNPRKYSLGLYGSSFRVKVKLRRWGEFKVKRWSDQTMNIFFGILFRNYLKDIA